MCIYRTFFHLLKNHLSTPPKGNLSFFVSLQGFKRSHDVNETLKFMHIIFLIFFGMVVFC